MQRENSFIGIIEKYLASDKIMLPVFDETALRIQNEIAKEEPSVPLIEELIGHDPSLTSQVLKTANSAFYRGLTKISTIRNAVIRLGAKKVSNIVTLVTQRKNYHSKDPFCRSAMEKLWRHSTGCAIGSQWLAGQCNFQKFLHETFTAGLLHDVGKLLLLKVVEDIRLSKKLDFKPSEALLNEVMDGFHTEHGYSLLKNWNLPEIYCQVAREHHSKEYDTNNALLVMVRLANEICNKLGIGLIEDPSIVPAATQEANLLGLSEIVLAKLEIELEDAMNRAL